MAFTMKQHVQTDLEADRTDLEADRQVANTLAELIIGGWLFSAAIVHPVPDGSEASVSGQRTRQPSGAGTAMSSTPFTNPFTNRMQKAPSVIGKGL